MKTNTPALPNLHSILQTMELPLHLIYNIRTLDQATHMETNTSGTPELTFHPAITFHPANSGIPSSSHPQCPHTP